LIANVGVGVGVTLDGNAGVGVVGGLGAGRRRRRPRVRFERGSIDRDYPPADAERRFVCFNEIRQVGALVVEIQPLRSQNRFLLLDR
jgi:hypothetical protein